MGTGGGAVVAGLTLALAAGAAFLLAVRDDDPPAARPALAAEVDVPVVEYRVGGDEAGAVTYSNSTGGTAQTEVDLRDPWRYSLGRVDPASEFLYVSVQNQRSYGHVSCQIVAGSTVLASASSDAEYGIATCSYP